MTEFMCDRCFKSLEQAKERRGDGVLGLMRKCIRCERYVQQRLGHWVECPEKEGAETSTEDI